MKTMAQDKWKDKKFKRQYNKEYRERQKMLACGITPVQPGDSVSPWKQKQLEKKAREESTRAHPLGLEACPFCGAAFFRKLNDKYEPIKMDNCSTCEKRFYFYNGTKQ